MLAGFGRDQVSQSVMTPLSTFSQSILDLEVAQKE